MEKNNDGIDRRSVLRGIGTTAMSVSFVGTATAESRRDVESAGTDPFHDFAAGVSTDVDEATQADLVDRYADPESVKAAFRGDADPILEALVAEEYLESATLSAFEFGEVRTDEYLAPTDAATGVGVMAIEHDEEGASAYLMATTDSADHRVALYRQPELDNTYAVVESEEGEQTFVHDLDGDVSISADCGWEHVTCYTNSICSTYPTTCTEHQRYCCYGPDYSQECSSDRYVCECSC